jgi:hypothetical protein
MMDVYPNFKTNIIITHKLIMLTHRKATKLLRKLTKFREF